MRRQKPDQSLQCSEVQCFKFQNDQQVEAQSHLKYLTESR
jgi:hypothetical protein